MRRFFVLVSIAGLANGIELSSRVSIAGSASGSNFSGGGGGGSSRQAARRSLEGASTSGTIIGCTNPVPVQGGCAASLGLLKGDGQEAGYLLITPHTSTDVWLVDASSGDIVHSWSTPYGTGHAVYLAPGGDIVRLENNYSAAYDIGIAGGASHISAYDAAGELLFTKGVNQATHRLHHQFELSTFDARAKTGTLFALAAYKLSCEEARGLGRTSCNEGDGLYVEAVLEIDTEGDVVWEWYMSNHVCDGCDNLTKVPINSGSGKQKADWVHANSLVYDAEKDVLLMGGAYTNEVYVINHTSPSETPLMGDGAPASLLYRFGAGRFGEQHDVRVLPCEDGLCFTVFNNGRYEKNGCTFDGNGVQETDCSSEVLLTTLPLAVLDPSQATPPATEVVVQTLFNASTLPDGLLGDGSGKFLRLTNGSDVPELELDPFFSLILASAQLVGEPFTNGSYLSVMVGTTGTLFEAYWDASGLGAYSDVRLVWQVPGENPLGPGKGKAPTVLNCTLPGLQKLSDTPNAGWTTRAFNAQRYSPDIVGCQPPSPPPAPPIAPPPPSPPSILCTNPVPVQGGCAASLGLLKGDGQEAGYLLITPHTSTDVWLVDASSGDIVHSWSTPYGTGHAVYLAPGGDIVRLENNYSAAYDIGIAGGASHISAYDAAGELLFTKGVNQATHRLHHQFELSTFDARAKTGTLFALAAYKLSCEEARGLGRTSCNEGDGLYVEAVLEIDTEGDVVWEWYMSNHVCDGCDNLTKVPINSGSGKQKADWVHANSLVYDAEKDVLLMGGAYTNEVYVINHTSPSETPLMGDGAPASLLYRFGAGRFGEQHDVRVLPCEDGLCFTVFNNGRYEKNGCTFDGNGVQETDCSSEVLLTTLPLAVLDPSQATPPATEVVVQTLFNASTLPDGLLGDGSGKFLRLTNGSDVPELELDPFFSLILASAQLVGEPFTNGSYLSVMVGTTGTLFEAYWDASGLGAYSDVRLVWQVPGENPLGPGKGKAPTVLNCTLPGLQKLSDTPNAGWTTRAFNAQRYSPDIVGCQPPVSPPPLRAPSASPSPPPPSSPSPPSPPPAPPAAPPAEPPQSPPPSASPSPPPPSASPSPPPPPSAPSSPPAPPSSPRPLSASAAPLMPQSAPLVDASSAAPRGARPARPPDVAIAMSAV
mmetsp:Transcript_7885/g.23148  ORF Transcript_7885/g.23148 Transcript_7885/m.23148 type:complete len:1157 (+) Transcript_7885:61-3531(+)